MKTIREHDWENIIVKGNYVGTNLAGRRAGAALEMVKEDGGQLLKDVKNYMPKKFHVSDLCLVEILFMLMARMGIYFVNRTRNLKLPVQLVL